MNDSNSKAFFFDLDNTLFDYEASFKQASLFAFKSIFYPVLENPVNIEEWFDTYKIYCDLYWPAYEDKKLTRDDYQRNRLVSSLTSLNIQPFNNRQLDDFRTLWEEKIPSFVTPYPWIKGIIDSLNNRGFEVGLITNGGSELQRKKLSRLGLSFLANNIFISSEISFAKPSLEIFEYVMGRTDAENFYYVGDSFTFDIKPAVEAGWTGIWWNPSRQVLDKTNPLIVNCCTVNEFQEVIKKCIE
jgi:HAD superfamily hydrolase (TIGR01549 family)